MPKKIGIIQSNYLPWRGYFDFIQSVDTFVFLEDVQYTERDWRNRNKIRAASGFRWISVPVKFSRLNPTFISETPINYGVDWVQENLKWLELAYKKRPYFGDVYSVLEAIFKERPDTISDLNIRLITWVCKYLGIQTELVSSAELGVAGVKDDKLLGIVRELGGDTYLSGPAARSYIRPEIFEAENIKLEYKQYGYQPYEQGENEFIDGLSIVDTICNCGPNSRQYILLVSEKRLEQ